MFLYFIKGGDAIKVGITDNVEKRLIGIQTGNPSKVELLQSISMSDEEARKAESEIHRIFIKTNLSGEWYQATQFMLEFIKNIKENGWESHLSWIEKKHEDMYREILSAFKKKVERDIIYGNLISLERLKKELGELLNAIFVIPSLPKNMSEAVKIWIEEREDPFTHRDIYNRFGISTRKGKVNISQILCRLIDAGKIEKSPEGIFSKIK
jgi:hypothetical protein